jgi:hypothetical protein
LVVVDSPKIALQNAKYFVKSAFFELPWRRSASVRLLLALIDLYKYQIKDLIHGDV